MDKERKRKEKNAYMTLEACFIMPITVILTAFLLILTFYLYTVCFLNQAAYIAAFRASLTDGAGYEREAKAEEELEKLLAEALIRELAERYGNAISGFWIDGMNPEMKSFPAEIRRRFPDAVIINNNNTSLDIEEVDCGTTEFLSGIPEPSYCRPSALRTSGPPFYISIPGHDFNEDIPTCCAWWYQGPGKAGKDAEEERLEKEDDNDKKKEED